MGVMNTVSISDRRRVEHLQYIGKREDELQMDWTYDSNTCTERSWREVDPEF